MLVNNKEYMFRANIGVEHKDHTNDSATIGLFADIEDAIKALYKFGFEFDANALDKSIEDCETFNVGWLSSDNLRFVGNELFVGYIETLCVGRVDNYAINEYFSELISE